MTTAAGSMGILIFSEATSRKSRSLTESSILASLSGSCWPTSNVKATLRTSPGIMFETSKRPSRSKRPSPVRLRMLAWVSYERPLPTFFTVRYMVTASPRWTRPSPLPLRLSAIW